MECVTQPTTFSAEKITTSSFSYKGWWMRLGIQKMSIFPGECLGSSSLQRPEIEILVFYYCFPENHQRCGGGGERGEYSEHMPLKWTNLCPRVEQEADYIAANRI